MLGSRHLKSKNVRYKSLLEAGFTQNEIDNVQKTVKKKIDLLHKLSSVSCSNLIKLRENGFSLEQLIKVVGNGNGFKNVMTLHHLLEPILLNGQLLVDGLNQLITPFSQLLRAGFTGKQLIMILNHSGGSNNLTALHKLLQPIFHENRLLVDAFHQPVTPLLQLLRVGFTAEQLTKVLSHDGGSINMMALQQSLQPMSHESGLLLVDEFNQPIIPLSQLLQAGFTAPQLIMVIGNKGGAKSLAALQNFLRPIVQENGQLLVDKFNQLITPLSQWLQEGFTVTQLIKLLSHDGGSKNLAALQKLVQPIFHGSSEEFNQSVTPLSQLLKAGFTVEQLIGVLSHDGGSNNLAALQKLLEPIFPDEELLSITPLSLLLQEGFTTEQLIEVVGHVGGSHNLAALQNLLQLIFSVSEPLLADGFKQPSTPLCQLLRAGFTTEQIIRILSRNGGYKNLLALQDLLKPPFLVEPSQPLSPLSELLQTGIVTEHTPTPLSQLLQIGFTTEQLIDVLGNAGGASNLAALQQFVGNHFLVDPNACDIISNLGSDNSKSAHLIWLHSLLSHPEYAQYITEFKCLGSLCNKIKYMSISNLGSVTINSIESLRDFICSASRKRSRELEPKERSAKVSRHSFFNKDQNGSPEEENLSINLPFL